MDRISFLRNLKQGIEMNRFKVELNKNKNMSRDDLLNLSKEKLVDLVIRLQTHNQQLKNVIAKKNNLPITVRPEVKDNSKKKREFDFQRYQTRRIFLRIAYLGVNYRGLAVQDDCPDTIEAHLFSALTKGCLIKSREVSNYHRCGRTDKGVSASGQVISIEVRSRLTLDEQLVPDGGRFLELQYCKILNRLLPPDIRAIAWVPAPMTQSGEYLSARFDCKQRTYKYWFPRGSLDIDAMRNACKHLCGSFDFRNLCKMDVANGVTSFIRQITHADIVKEKSGDDSGYEMYYILICANAFLWHQIRCIAGVLFLIGSGYEDPDIIQQLLDVDNNPRKPQYNMAIDLPLNLFHCAYEFLEDYEDTKRDGSGIFKIKDLNRDSKENDGNSTIDHCIKRIDIDLNSNKNSEDTIITVSESTLVDNDNLMFNQCGKENNELSQLNTNDIDKMSKDNICLDEDSLINDTSLREIENIEHSLTETDSSNDFKGKIAPDKQPFESSGDPIITQCKEKEYNSNDENVNSVIQTINNTTSFKNLDTEDKKTVAYNKTNICSHGIEPMDLSEDSFPLSGRVFIKKDWWFVDLEDLSIVIKNFQALWSKATIQASMIRDVIQDLEGIYNKACIQHNCLLGNEIIHKEKIVFKHQHDIMLQGVKPKIYQPLLKRSTCESLENRIEHYVKKKRLRKTSEEKST